MTDAGIPGKTEFNSFKRLFQPYVNPRSTNSPQALSASKFWLGVSHAPAKPWETLQTSIIRRRFLIFFLENGTTPRVFLNREKF